MTAADCIKSIVSWPSDGAWIDESALAFAAASATFGNHCAMRIKSSADQASGGVSPPWISRREPRGAYALRSAGFIAEASLNNGERNPSMLRRLLAVSLLVVATFLTAAAPAQENLEKPPAEEKLPEPRAEAKDAPVLAPPHCGPTVDLCLPIHKVQIVETQELIAIPRLTIREEVTRVPFVGIDVEYKEEKRTVTIMVPKPRKEERQVMSMSLIPETSIDPCTGCPCTTMKECPICKTVLVDVVEIVPEERTYTVQVPVLKPVDKDALVKRLVVDNVTVPALEKRLKAVETKADITVPVPVCQPACLSAPH